MVQAAGSEPLDQNIGSNPLDGENSSHAEGDSPVSQIGRRISDSSRMLVLAAEKLAGDSLTAFDELVHRTEQAITLSAEMAKAAAEAATETRRIADNVSASVNQATDRARDETQAWLRNPDTRSELTQHTVEAVQAGVDGQIENAVRRIEETASASQDAAARASRAAADAAARASQAEASVDLVARTSEQTLADIGRKVDALAEKVEESVAKASLLNEQAQENTRELMRASDEAIRRGQQTEPGGPGGLDPAAQALLERLEAGYGQLTGLVRELHERGAATPETAPRAISDWQPASKQGEEPRLAERAPVTDSPAEVSLSIGNEAVPATFSSYFDDPPPLAQPSTDDAAQSETDLAGDQPSVTGRVIVNISPVPDYDRLLSLDSALGQIAGVASVSLIDYAQEEVAFRIETNQPVSIEVLRGSLSNLTNSQIDLADVAEDTIDFRLAS